MVDIHNHILYGIDDGSKTIEESIALLKAGEKLGFKIFILTAHYNRKKKYFCKGYNYKFKELQKEIEREKLNIKILKGSEVYLDENYKEILEEKEFLFLGNEKYILIEVNPLEIFPLVKKKIKYILDKGYIPIVAHCERYENFKISEFLEIKKLGGLLQINISGINKNKHLIKHLIKDRAIDFIGSDVHGLKTRNYNLSKELKILKKLMGPKYFEEITSWKKGEKNEGENINIDRGINRIWKNLFARIGVR